MLLQSAEVTRPPFLPSANVNFWPFLPVNEGLNGAESDFRFVLESRRSECTYWDRAECPLMAESSRWLTVNMQGCPRICEWLLLAASGVGKGRISDRADGSHNIILANLVRMGGEGRGIARTLTRILD